MRGRQWGPRLGLGRDRIDPERARFHAAADVLRYFSDLHECTQTQLAERCGVRREQMTRWLTGAREPTLSRLSGVLEPLGWTPVLMLERTEAAVNDLVDGADPPERLLGYDVRAIVNTARAGVEAGLDVVVGGEAAAVLQGISVPTRHLVLHVRPDHCMPFLRLAAKRWHDVTPLCGGWVLRHGPVSVDVVSAPVRPASRIVTDTEGRTTLVVDLDELLAAPDGVGPSVRAVAARPSRGRAADA